MLENLLLLGKDFEAGPWKDLEPLLYESAYQWIRPILYFL